MTERRATRTVTPTDAASEFRTLAEWDWVYTATGDRLHHCAEVLDDTDAGLAGVNAVGRTTCGIQGRFFIPGMLSRMGMDRCARCCDRLGWPRGTGSPKNDDALRPLVEARIGGQGYEARDPYAEGLPIRTVAQAYQEQGGPLISEKRGPPQEEES